ncbi:hypothetical protein BD410DRAFT_844852 [Rickenella mellea]|uniref:Uncharacterized protein n=1 Tax=Rickenella mellea TaxID=50990 RepID=A0A4Y7PN11_9AGAM|nr:hypothetical protein BD410DRAFT_844852 [Rickenella mellea]
MHVYVEAIDDCSSQLEAPGDAQPTFHSAGHDREQDVQTPSGVARLRGKGHTQTRGHAGIGKHIDAK